MSKAERRARKRENKRRAQQQRYARWRRIRRRRLGSRILAVALVAALAGTGATFVLAGDEAEAPPITTTTGEPTTTTLPPDLAAIECTDETPEPGEKPRFDAPETVVEPGAAYRATIDTTCGPIVAELDPSDPQISEAGVNNFVFLAREGFYDGLTFHRVVADFVIQGGDPEGSGRGGPGYTFGGEDDVSDDLTYEVGDLVYANSGSDPSTSGSQFFVVTGEAGTNLPPRFVKFGRVVEGLEVAQRLEAFVEPGTEAPSRPLHIFEVSVEEA